MTALHISKRMTVDEFLVWAEAQSGRHELWDGLPVAMSPEQLGHARIKFAVAVALANGIRRAGLQCHLLPDGVTVAIDESTAYEPDAVIYCGDQQPDSGLAVKDPIIVVEVLSPSTKGIDTGRKFTGYFALPSVGHYLIVDPMGRTITHHARSDGEIRSRILRDGEVRLDPPGLAFDLGEAFGAA